MKYQNYSEISYEKSELFWYFMIPIFHTTPAHVYAVSRQVPGDPMKSRMTSYLRCRCRSVHGFLFDTFGKCSIYIYSFESKVVTKESQWVKRKRASRTCKVLHLVWRWRRVLTRALFRIIEQHWWWILLSWVQVFLPGKCLSVKKARHEFLAHKLQTLTSQCWFDDFLEFSRFLCVDSSVWIMFRGGSRILVRGVVAEF